MERTLRTSLAVLFGLAAFAGAQIAQAAAAPYYEGKVLTIVVGYGPGGGYDRVARLLAKHLPKHIPGKPSVIVENMPGADSMIATNHIFNKAAADGLTIGTFNRGLLYAQLLKAPGVRFDLTKAAWIGSAASEGSTLVIRTDLPYRNIQELQKAKDEVHLGNTGPADSGGVFATLVTEALGLKAKMIAYPSSAEVMLAIERKEVDGRGASFTSARPFIDRNLVRPLLRGRVIEEGMEKLPLDEDLVTDPKWKRVLAVRSTPDRIGRPYIAPPKTPEDVLKILRDAFAKVAQDPELKAEAKKMEMSIEYTNAADTMKVLNEFFAAPADVVKELGRFIKF